MSRARRRVVCAWCKVPRGRTYAGFHRRCRDQIRAHVEAELARGPTAGTWSRAALARLWGCGRESLRLLELLALRKLAIGIRGGEVCNVCHGRETVGADRGPCRHCLDGEEPRPRVERSQ